MASQIINISLPKELVDKIDKAARDQYGSRSEYIRQAVVGRLRTQDTNVWSELESTAEELSTKAERAGLISDEDFVQAVKEVRQAKKL